MMRIAQNQSRSAVPPTPPEASRPPQSVRLPQSNASQPFTTVSPEAFLNTNQYTVLGSRPQRATGVLDDNSDFRAEIRAASDPNSQPLLHTHASFNPTASRPTTPATLTKGQQGIMSQFRPSDTLIQHAFAPTARPDGTPLVGTPVVLPNGLVGTQEPSGVIQVGFPSGAVPGVEGEVRLAIHLSGSAQIVETTTENARGFRVINDGNNPKGQAYEEGVRTALGLPPINRDAGTVSTASVSTHSAPPLPPTAQPAQTGANQPVNPNPAPAPAPVPHSPASAATPRTNVPFVELEEDLPQTAAVPASTPSVYSSVIGNQAAPVTSTSSPQPPSTSLTPAPQPTITAQPGTRGAAVTGASPAQTRTLNAYNPPTSVRNSAYAPTHTMDGRPIPGATQIMLPGGIPATRAADGSVQFRVPAGVISDKEYAIVFPHGGSANIWESKNNERGCDLILGNHANYEALRRAFNLG